MAGERPSVSRYTDPSASVRIHPLVKRTRYNHFTVLLLLLKDPQVKGSICKIQPGCEGTATNIQQGAADHGVSLFVAVATVGEDKDREGGAKREAGSNTIFSRL